MVFIFECWIWSTPKWGPIFLFNFFNITADTYKKCVKCFYCIFAFVLILLYIYLYLNNTLSFVSKLYKIGIMEIMLNHTKIHPCCFVYLHYFHIHFCLTYQNLFIHFHSDGHLGVQSFSFTNSVAVNIITCVSWYICMKSINSVSIMYNLLFIEKLYIYWIIAG